MGNSLVDFYSKDGYELRNVEDADVDDLVTLINEAYSYQDEVKGESRTNPKHLRKRIAETDFYVIVHHKEIIGCVYLEPKDSALHFGLLTLVPEHRNKGVAQSVMAAIEKYAKSNRFTNLDLDYMSLAPWLKAYYEKYDFAETGEVIGWGNIDLIRMSKNL